MTALSRLARRAGAQGPTASGAVGAAHHRQCRGPARAGAGVVAGQAFSAAPGNMLAMDGIVRWLELNGYTRTSTVREAGEYAVRGGIIDLFPPGVPEPVRLDFFGDTLESIRTFDPETQRSTDQLRALDLVPAAEFQLTSETIRRFRTGYVQTFGAAAPDDLLYEAVSEGRRYPGMEHWLPLFHDRLDTLFDYLPGTPVAVEPLAEDAAHERFAQIADYYEARRQALAQPRDKTAAARRSLQAAAAGPALSGRGRMARAARCAASSCASLPFAAPDGTGRRRCRHPAGPQFRARSGPADANVFEAVKTHVDALQAAGKRVVFALWSEGARDRMSHVLADHGLLNLVDVATWPQALARPRIEIALAVLGLEAGFETDSLAVIGEQDILGDRLVRPRRGSKRAENFIAEATALAAGDLVVHVDHGIGRFVGLKTIEAAGAPHDCLEIHYAGNDKLFLPVENIELLSRYGSEETAVELDRLGGAAWQARKARMKSRIREMAGELIKIAAERHLREAPRLVADHGLYDEFCANFPYDETDDQRAAIDAVLDDLASGRPMDRLICGDVGFGKTEVALRAAFVTAMSGKQVAVVVPTTLLARQHFKTFSERFRGLPIIVAQASRLVGNAELAKVKEGLAAGTVDIVIGTHALLGKAIKFRDLGLLVVDEEQHFGVAHKERLKTLRAEVHVLTLTATPIPRTLQLALTGVRELSIIASPPVDRLAVRTTVAPFDPLIVREALLRERYRGGQSFYVCPRIEYLAEAKAFLDSHVPGGARRGRPRPDAGGRAGGRDVRLLRRQIRRAAVDHDRRIRARHSDRQHADRRSRRHVRPRPALSVARPGRPLEGRAPMRCSRLPATRKITPQAERRLKVLQSLDTLGAGFQLASHDLDIRGAGNLLGEEQSGHIKEVGFELYQQMLEEAVASLKAGIAEPVADRWSPQIMIGTPVLIPEDYVADLPVRLNLYRRLAELEDEREIDAFGAEMADRFGPLPPEVRHLLATVVIKALCRRANVAKIEAGPKGAVVSFRDDRFANPEGLVAFIREQGRSARVRPDMKLVLFADWEAPEDRLKGTAQILRRLVAIAERAKAA